MPKKVESEAFVPSELYTTEASESKRQTEAELHQADPEDKQGKDIINEELKNVTKANR